MQHFVSNTLRVSTRKAHHQAFYKQKKYTKKANLPKHVQYHVLNKILFCETFQLRLIDYLSTDTSETQLYAISHTDLLIYLLIYVLTHALTYLLTCLLT